MHEETVGSKIVKWVLIGVSVLFLVLMLLLPLLTVISEALRDGWKTYQAAVTDKYTVKAVLLTLEATAIAVGFNTIFGIFAALAVTKFHFRGKKLLTTERDLSAAPRPGNPGGVCGARHYSGYGIRYVSICLPGTDSGAGIPGDR